MATPFQPLTKEHAAEILSVSKRTVENWIAAGEMPSPTTIGRRVYWHPDIFYSWLNDKLGNRQGGQNIPAARESVAARRRGRPRATMAG